MNRMLKMFGLLALAAVAMTALFASAASATGTGTATVGKAGEVDTYTAVQSESHKFTLPNARVLTCTTAEFGGSITNNATTVEAVPNYDGCTAKAGETVLPVTVTNENTCKYHFQLAGGTVGATGEWAATTKLTCTTPITIQVYASEAAHKAGTVLCDYDVPNQEGLTGVRFRNVAGGKVGIKPVNVNVTINKTVGTIANCGANGHTTSLYNGDTIATGAGGTLGIH